MSQARTPFARWKIIATIIAQSSLRRLSTKDRSRPVNESCAQWFQKHRFIFTNAQLSLLPEKSKTFRFSVGGPSVHGGPQPVYRDSPGPDPDWTTQSAGVRQPRWPTSPRSRRVLGRLPGRVRSVGPQGKLPASNDDHKNHLVTKRRVFPLPGELATGVVSSIGIEYRYRVTYNLDEFKFLPFLNFL